MSKPIVIEVEKSSYLDRITAKRLRFRNMEKTINNQQSEINELKAMVNNLIKVGSLMSINLGYSDDCFASDYQAKWAKVKLETPKRCLATASAKAITDAIYNSEQIDIEGHKYVGLEDLQVNINQLLEK